MKFVDTHAHIYLSQFQDDIEEVLERSQEAGVDRVFMPNIDESSIDDMFELEERYPGYCIPMMGLHPSSVKKDFQRQLYLVEKWVNERKFAGVGEIGTDLYWDKSFWGQQQEAIQIQLGWAKEKGWPAIIHCRESIDETIQIVEDLNDERLSGIFHCFTGTIDQAKRITEMGFYLGIGGVSTFKNGGMEKILEEIDLKYLVLETDSPYLAPAPNRGKRNEPAYIPLIANRIAELKSLSLDEVSETTTLNSLQIFEHYEL